MSRTICCASLERTQRALGRASVAARKIATKCLAVRLRDRPQVGARPSPLAVILVDASSTNHQHARSVGAGERRELWNALEYRIRHRGRDSFDRIDEHGQLRRC